MGLSYCNKRSHHNEKLTHHNKEQSLLTINKESWHKALKTQSTQKQIQLLKKKFFLRSQVRSCPYLPSSFPSSLCLFLSLSILPPLLCPSFFPLPFSLSFFSSFFLQAESRLSPGDDAQMVMGIIHILSAL